MVAGIWVSTSHIPDLGVAAFVGDGEGLRELHIGSSVTSALDLIGQENRDAAERVSESARVVSGYSVRDIIDAWRSGEDLSDLALRPIGTPFQQMVWSGLKAIPRGQTQSYQVFASTIGRPTAVRAVASACANNRLALLIPCHRVVRSDGSLGGFRWGLERKRQLLAWEKASWEGFTACRDLLG